MKSFILLAGIFLMTTISKPENINFGKESGGQDWWVLNDGVMGGLSQGAIQFTDESLLFKGKVSLENNGGFASIRSPFQAIDLSTTEMIEIRYRATGQSFALTLAKDRRYYIPNYKHSLPETAGEWKTVQMPLKNFKEHQVGRPTGNFLTPELRNQIIRMGLITNDKRASDFELEVDYLTFQ